MFKIQDLPGKLANTMITISGVYILASQKNSSPTPLKFFPVFVDFFALFKLYKGILTCVSFFLLGGNGQNIYPCDAHVENSNLLGEPFYCDYMKWL